MQYKYVCCTSICAIQVNKVGLKPTIYFTLTVLAYAELMLKNSNGLQGFFFFFFFLCDAELLLLHNARQIFLICINQYNSTYLDLKEPSRLLDTSN